MAGDDLAWRVEEACLNAWPSPRQAILGGWLLRASGGPTRRTNSVNPLRGGPRDPNPLLAPIEAAFAGLGQPAIFRVPEIAAGMESSLERAGYRAEGETVTLFRPLGEASRRPLPGGAWEARLSGLPEAAWLAAWARFNDAAKPRLRIYRAMLEAIVPVRRFAATVVEGGIAGLAYGVLQDGLLAVESVVTDPARRRQGLATASVARLLDWARSEGGSGACLQVEAGNAPALALYRALGFDRELYRYHYRRRPALD